MVNFELIFKKDKTQNSLAISSKYTETLKFQWNLPRMPFGNVKNIQLVWCQDFGRIDWTKISFGSFAHLTVLVRDKPQFFKLFAITTWSLWNHRNKCCFNEAIGSLEIIVDSYRNQLLNFKQCREITLKKPRPAKKVWVPPAVDSLKKLLWVIFEEYDEAGIGVVFQNSHNNIMAALSERILKPSSMVILASISPSFKAIPRLL